MTIESTADTERPNSSSGHQDHESLGSDDNARLEYLEAEVDKLRERMQLFESRLMNPAQQAPAPIPAPRAPCPPPARTKPLPTSAPIPTSSQSQEMTSPSEPPRHRRRSRKMRKKLYKTYAAVVATVIVVSMLIMLFTLFSSVSPFERYNSDKEKIKIDVMDSQPLSRESSTLY